MDGGVTTFKNGVAIAVSLVALAISLFNLWWGTFRRRIALFFIPCAS